MPRKPHSPQPMFVCSTGKREGLPVVAAINVALARFSFCRDFPWLAEVELAAESTDGQGLPSVDEVGRLDEVEREIQQALDPLGAHFVARQTWQGRRMLDYYLSDEPAGRKVLDKLVRSGMLARPAKFRLSRDEDWSVWMPTLICLVSSPQEIERDDNLEQEVLIRIPLGGGEFGSDDEQRQVLKLADDLAELTSEMADSEFDGYEFGDGEATLYAYTADAERLSAAYEPALRRSPVARGAVLVKRFGRVSDPEARETTVSL